MSAQVKKVFVDVFTDHQQKFLIGRLDHTRGYLTTFANDERKDIAHRFLDRIEQSIVEAYEQAMAEDAELHNNMKKNGKQTMTHTTDQQRENAEIVIAKQLHYLERTLLVNINFAEKQFLDGSISSKDKDMLTEMNQDLLGALAVVRDDYQRPA